eukprot:2156472-Rhodomonas_salina.4
MLGGLAVQKRGGSLPLRTTRPFLFSASSAVFSPRLKLLACVQCYMRARVPACFVVQLTIEWRRGERSWMSTMQSTPRYERAAHASRRITHTQLSTFNASLGLDLTGAGATALLSKQGLMKLYDEYKDVYHKERTSEMVLV